MRKKPPLPGEIFVLSGPSGSGKTTLLNHLLEDRFLSRKLVKSVSYTTRPRRSKERGRRDYFFVTKQQFEKAKKAKKILEWTRYLGYYYATPKDFVDKQLSKGKNIVLCLDRRGAFQVKRLYPQNTVTIFVAPPSLESLHQRISGRCPKTGKDEIRGRLRLARKEVRDSSRYDHRLVNKELAQAVKRLKSIIVKEIDRGEL